MTTAHPVIVVAGLALMLIGCQHSSPRGGPPVASPTEVPGQGRAVGLCSGYRSIYGPWAVAVTTPDGALSVTRLSGTGSATIGTTAWTATEGAFLFVESPDRIWAFDGDDNLFMLQAAASTLISYGPHTFPVTAPSEVAARLPAGFRSQLRVYGR